MLSDKNRITKRPDRYYRGQKLRARQLNQLGKGIEQLSGGARPPVQLTTQAGAGAQAKIARFVITEVADDYLVCREFDGVQQGSNNIFIAKPPLLRNSVTARGGITYTYTGTDARTADDGSATEDQVIVPGYLVNDEIYAIAGVVRGAGVFSDPDNTQKIEWLDLNLDARAWAAVEE